MKLTYKKSQSTIYPELLDTTSSKTTVYIRKDVQEIQVKTDISDENSETVTMYEYDEAKLTKPEYQSYLMEQQQSQIDYIAMMTDVEL